MKKELIYTALAALVIGGLFVLAGSFIPKFQVIQQNPQEVGAVSSPFYLGSVTCADGPNSPCTQSNYGDCANATTTLFNVVSPAATSTLTLGQLWGLTGTSSLDIVVASTTSANLISATTSAYAPFFINIASTTRNTKFYGTLGSIGAFDASETNASTKTRIVLPPSTPIVGFATSSYTATPSGSTSVTGSANTFSCSYKFRFDY